MEQLTDWLKRIREVGYADKGKKRLRIDYDKGEEVLEIKGKKGERYVEVRKVVEKYNHDYKGRYRLIEKQPGLGKRGDFRHCIFLVGIEFKEKEIEKEVDFSWSIFTQKIDFTGSTFKEMASFHNDFFYEEAGFWGTTFQKGSGFWGSTFQKKADFWGATFQERADFWGATFQGEADFSLSKIDFLNFFLVKGGSDYTINLKSAQIERINYTDTEFSKAENRETYLILKNLALKQNDQIRALDFYKEEMEQHWAELKFFKHPIDKTILFFEKHASQYGTDPLLAASWLISINIIFVITSQYDISIFEQSWVFSLEHLSWAWDHAVLMEPFIKFLTLRSEEYNLRHLASLILNPFLIYEIVKSLRKFSRKL